MTDRNTCSGTVTLLAVGSLLSACAGIQVQAEYDPSANFAGLESYAWIEPGDPGGAFDAQASSIRDELRQPMQDAVDMALSAKDMHQVARTEAQLLVSENIRIEARQRYSDPYYTSATVKTYREGTLIIDLLDAKTEELLWRGVGQTRLRNLDESATRDAHVQELVKAILAQYPPMQAKEK